MSVLLCSGHCQRNVRRCVRGASRGLLGGLCLVGALPQWRWPPGECALPAGHCAYFACPALATGCLRATASGRSTMWPLWPGRAHHTNSGSVSSAACKAESRRDLKPTKPAVRISDADRKRKILITGTGNLKCTMTLKKRPGRDKGESLRADRYRCIAGRCLYQIMSANTKVTKTKTALKQETYNLSDLKHDLHCGLSNLATRPRSHRDHHHRLQ